MVNENLGLVEAQLNSFKQKTDSIITSDALTKNMDPQINEEGLPIMDIREDVPDNYDEQQQKKKNANIIQTPTTELPPSVLRARELMKEADEKINQKKKAEQDKENKALFDLLKELEEEEEEEEEGEGEGKKVVSTPKITEINEDSDSDDFSDSEEDDRYDTEISENMFDRFGDDEEYPLDGVVDQEDFTAYDELPPQIPAASIKEVTEEEEEEEYEKSTPKVITKRKTQPMVDNPFDPPKEEPTKKMSRFKLAQQQQRESVETTVKENIPEETVPSVTSELPKKKFSKFKLLRQQQPRKPVEERVKEIVKEVVPAPVVVEEAPKEELKAIEEEATPITETKPATNSYPVQDNGVPRVVSNKPKKMSRFKLSRQKTEPIQPPQNLVEPIKQERIKPKRTVTWDSDISIKDHDNTMAPSVVSETTSYSQPMKNESTSKKPSLFKQIQQQQQQYIQDDYPSLDDESDTKIDLNQLVVLARDSSEAFWRPNDGSEALIPMFNQPNDEEEEEEEEEPTGIIVAKKNKLDNKIMKGAVMERDIVPVDLEQVEDDMDIREITSNYQQMRQSMLASTGGFSFDVKPEFEVFDEELPLPKKPNQPKEEEEQVAPKKMSRFKAARLGMRMDTEEQ